MVTSVLADFVGKSREAQAGRDDRYQDEQGADVAGKGIAEGSKVTVKYTEKAGEKTAVGVKTAGKATAKAVE